MTDCSEPCPACSKSCELDPQHALGFGKMAQTHEHSYEYIAKNRSGHAGFRVTITHGWRPKA